LTAAQFLAFAVSNSTSVSSTSASGGLFPGLAILEFLVPLVYFAAILIGTWIVARLASYVTGSLMRQSVPLLVAQARRVVWFIVWFVGIILAIEQLGIRSDVLLVVVGLLGVSVLIALRKPLENIGAKYFSDVYVPFKVGDSITVMNQSGKVVEVNSITTILLTDDDRLVSIPNSAMISEVLLNSTPQAWKEVTIPIVIGSGIDLAAFESNVLKNFNKLRLHLDKRFPPVLTIKSRTPQSTELALTIMILRPEQRDTIVTEVNKRISEVMKTMQQQKK
jgi:small conductance mechanosensitive channel